MSPKTDTKIHPIRRFRIGFFSITQVLLVVLIFVAVNFLSSQHHSPFDVSDDLGFTLAPSTTRYLAAPDVQDRESPIRITVAFRADSPFYERIRPVAEEYARLAAGKISLKIIDPIRANDAAEAIAAEYGIVFSQDLVIIDARSPADKEGESADSRASGHVHIVKLEDMLVYETDANQQRRVRGFLGEDALRAGLVAAIEGEPRRLWVLSDKSDLTSESNSAVWTILSAGLVSQNIVPERVPIAGVQRIPEDVSGVAIISANYDLSPEDLAVLEDYWNRPRAAILVTTGPSDVPVRLRAFLRSQGITPQSDRVLSEGRGVVRTSVRARFTSGLEFSRDLWEKVTLLEGYTRSLDVREGAEDLLNRQVRPYTLLECAPDFWGETRFPNEKPEFDPNEDRSGPLPIAAAAIKGIATDDRTAGDVSRMIVIGNTAFLHPDHATQLNLDFLATCANWLVGRETLSGEGPRNLRVYKLPILDPQRAFINRINLIFLPLFYLLVGGIVWSSRRL